MSSYEIRPFEDSDVPAVVELVALAMGPERRFPFDEAYWRWKHHDNPFGRSACLVAVTASGQVVGVRAFMRWTWSRGDELVPSVRAVDTAVHPDWQGRGLFTRLTKALLEHVAAEGVRFVFNTPNARSRPGYLKMGWRPVGRPTLWIRPLRPLASLAALLWGGRRGGKAPEPPPGTAVDLAPGGDTWGTPAGDRLGTAKSPEYLRWRYDHNPTARYAAWRTGAATVVARVGRRRGLSEALVCETILRDTSVLGLPAAARALRSLCRGVDADYVAACANGDPLAAAALSLAGFLPAPRLSPVLTARDLGEHVAPRSLRELSLTIGDLELF
ncbi:MAG: GNAT family N-acetyltransferase [Planctomycetota bacterium]|nr:GNAT family N-acetyltransferase [Planctomycetota bacterium]